MIGLKPLQWLVVGLALACGVGFIVLKRRAKRKRKRTRHQKH